MTTCPVEISICMCVYTEPHDWISKAINSILNQTYKNFELIIVNDNPNDGKLNLFLSKFNDNRIHLVHNSINIGLANSLNKGFQLAKGKYFARMDADDISMPNRIEKQFDFLEANKNIDLIGTNILVVDEKEKELYLSSKPTSCKKLKKIIQYKSVVFHPTWMFRSEVFADLNGYRNFPTSQDYDFTYRLLDKGYIISNLQEVLLHYRYNKNGITISKALIQKKIKKYIVELHQQRIKLGHDSFNAEMLNKILKVDDKESANFHSAQTKYLLAEDKWAESHYFGASRLLLQVILTSKWHRLAILNTFMEKLVTRL